MKIFMRESAPRAGGGEGPRIPWPRGAKFPTSEFGRWCIRRSSNPHHEQVVEEFLASLGLVARPDDDGAARHSVLEPPAVRRALRNRVSELGLAAGFWSLAALAIAQFSRPLWVEPCQPVHAHLEQTLNPKSLCATSDAFGGPFLVETPGGDTRCREQHTEMRRDWGGE